MSLDEECERPYEVLPSWYDPKGKALLFRYSKAFGLGFDPRNLHKPVLYGGDYDGIREVYTGFMLRQQVCDDLEREGMGWFMAFLRQLYLRQDFTLEELLEEAHNAGVRPFSGRNVL